MFYVWISFLAIIWIPSIIYCIFVFRNADEMPDDFDDIGVDGKYFDSRYGESSSPDELAAQGARERIAEQTVVEEVAE